MGELCPRVGGEVKADLILNRLNFKELMTDGLNYRVMSSKPANSSLKGELYDTNPFVEFFSCESVGVLASANALSEAVSYRHEFVFMSSFGIPCEVTYHHEYGSFVRKGTLLVSEYSSERGGYKMVVVVLTDEEDEEDNHCFELGWLTDQMMQDFFPASDAGE